MIIKPSLQYSKANDDIVAVVDGMALSPLAKIVLANRATDSGMDTADLMTFAPQRLDSPESLPDIDVAAERIAKAVVSGEIIALETDHDVDGVTSHAVIYLALTQYFGVQKENVLQYIGHRLEEGYGLSDPLCERILAQDIQPSLIITADNGTSDELRIKRLKECGIDTIVTDHHGIPDEGVPVSAIACVSPARQDSRYPDPLIAGVMVAWLTMCHTRNILNSRYGMNVAKLGGLLDFVALGTIADCVSMSRSVNNRIVVRAGLNIMNRKARPCWKVFGTEVIDQAKPIDTGDLGFKLGPRINAVGRLGDAMTGVCFLLSETEREADYWINHLNQENDLRREIEGDLKEIAFEIAQEQVSEGRNSVLVFLGDGHGGVHGIVSSRIVEGFGRPAVCFSKKVGEEGVITGSARSIPGVHVLEVFKAVHALHPEVFIKFGGHAGAGGLTIYQSGFEKFGQAFEAEVTKRIRGQEIGPVILCDGHIDPSIITQTAIEGLAEIEPFGREFERPVFSSTMKVSKFRWIGQDKKTLKLNLVDTFGFSDVEGIWFGADINDADLADLSQVFNVVYTPDLNWWNGRAKVQIIIKQFEPAN